MFPGRRCRHGSHQHGLANFQEALCIIGKALTAETAITYGLYQAFEPFDAEQQTFAHHYLLYASSGTFHLEDATARWLLPPHRAAWIAAEIPVRIYATAPVTCCSVLFTTDFIARPAFDCRVFTVTPLVREMIGYAMRWGKQRDPHEGMANRFFSTLAELCTELAAASDQMWLPRGQSADLQQAIAYTLQHLAESPSLAEIAQIVAVSERTLARRFATETHMNWRQFLHRARMIRAAESLAESDLPVIEVAYGTGFESVSAFTSAFRTWAGETPTKFRRRLQSC